MENDYVTVTHILIGVKGYEKYQEFINSSKPSGNSSIW